MREENVFQPRSPFLIFYILKVDLKQKAKFKILFIEGKATPAAPKVNGDNQFPNLSISIHLAIKKIVMKT